MAFTKSPTSDTHNVVRIPSTGSPFSVSQTTTQVPYTLQYIDCYPQKVNQTGGNPIWQVIKRNGLVSRNTTGTITGLGVVPYWNCIAQALTNILFSRQANLYLLNYSTNAVTTVASTPGGFHNWSTATNAVDNTNALKFCVLEIAASTNNLYTFNEDGSSFTTTNLAAINVTGSRGLVFLNGYLFAANVAGNRIYNSTAGGVLTTWATTDFIAAEQYPDKIVWIDKHKNYLVAFGHDSIEFFYDAGIEVGSPLARQESYASQIGMTQVGNNGRRTAQIGDDLYFLGSNKNDSVGLYRIRNFKVELVSNNQYIHDILNFRDFTTGYTNARCEVEPVVINKTVMVLLNLYNNSYSLVYNPDDDAWWSISASSASDWPDATLRFGPMVYQTLTSIEAYPLYVYLDSFFDTSVKIKTPDYTDSVQVSSTIYTEVIDFGTNRYKHIARVDAIGDYGNNTLTLSYNQTPNYSQPYTEITPTRVPNSFGHNQQISWYNLGAARRFSLTFGMSGAGRGVHTGLDIEYNVGAT